MTATPPIAVRPEQPDDHDSSRRVVSAAFASEGEADLVEAIRASPEYVAEMALVATITGDVVGHVMISGAVLRRNDLVRGKRTWLAKPSDLF